MNNIRSNHIYHSLAGVYGLAAAATFEGGHAFLCGCYIACGVMHLVLARLHPARE